VEEVVTKTVRRSEQNKRTLTPLIIIAMFQCDKLLIKDNISKPKEDNVKASHMNYNSKTIISFYYYNL